MSVWSRTFPRLAGGDVSRRRAAERPGGPSHRPEPEEDVPLLVEEHDGLFVVSAPQDNMLGPEDVADLVRGLRTRKQVATLIAGAHAGAAPGFWPRLGELLDSVTAAGTTAVRLAAGGAGDHRPGHPAVAAGIAEDWDITVDAPAGPVLAIPGGSLFVPVPAGTAGGWWRFAPGAEPVPLGPRCPAPSWQAALGRAPKRTSGGCVVHQIPAGLLIRPAEASAPEPYDLFHAVPVDPRRPAVVVGVPFGEDVSAEEVADLLTPVLPELSGTVRLVPGGLDDLLPLSQRVADLLGAEVEVATGLPLFAASRPLGSYAARSVLIGSDGSPTWLPFVDTVMCRPSWESAVAPAPQLLRWSPPLPGQVRPEEGAVQLSDRWQVTVTRAGLWVSTLDSDRSSHQARQVTAEGPAIEVGSPGERLDGSLWPALSRLFGALSADLRACATVYVHGATSDGGRALRRLAIEYGLRTVRYTADASGPRFGTGPRSPIPAPGPAPSTARTGATVSNREPVKVPPIADPSPAVGAPTPAPPPVVGPAPVPAGPRPDPTTVPEPRPAAATEPQPAAGGATGATPGPVLDPPTDHVTGQQDRPASSGDVQASAAAELTGHERVPGRAGTAPGAAPAPGNPPEPARSPDAATRQPTGTARPATPRGQSARLAAPIPSASGIGPGDRPVRQSSRSTESERSAFRSLADSLGATSFGAVDRALDALSTNADVRAEARADLMAVTAYMGDPDGPLGHGELTRALRTGDDRLLSYAACLASGLHRMPTYQGLVLRGTGTKADHSGGPRPGDRLADLAPVSAVVPDGGPPLPGGACYAVWSVTGRRVRRLSDDHDGYDDHTDHNEVVFLAGTSFRVLDTRMDTASPLILLRELPGLGVAGTASARSTRPDAPAGLDEVDRAVLGWLDDALRGQSKRSGRTAWPRRCAGPIGEGP